MIPASDDTHDPARRSWVESAADPATDFPLQNLPFGIVRPAPGAEPRVGVAIGASVLDLRAAAADGLLGAPGRRHREALAAPALNELMALAPADRTALRAALHDLLRDTAPAGVRTRAQGCLAPIEGVELLLPARIGDFTDCFASRHHAANVAAIATDHPVPPAYVHLPLGVQGRTSSIVVSPAPMYRPRGQRRSRDGFAVGPTRRLDFELEVGFWLGPGVTRAPSPAEAQAHVFGVCLLNDWSARDMQALESRPLGPLLSKSFATSISPWVVTADALAPFRVAQAPDADRDARLPPYLDDAADRARGAIDLRLEARIATAAMRARGVPAAPVTGSSLRSLYWTPGQLVAHLASNGAPLRAGELVGSGTVSGPSLDTGGSLLELSRGGRTPVALADGETRAFLEDEDEVVLRGWCEAPGAVRIGLGECRGRVRPAR